MNDRILIDILVMALVTYLIRAIPITFVKGKINSTFVKSFIHYVPYAVLSAMTIPAIFFSTSSVISALAGLAAAIAVAFFGRSLLTVAMSSCAAVLISEIILSL